MISGSLCKKTFSIALGPHQGSPAIQVQKLAKGHDALLKALREHPNLALTEERLATLALLQSFGLKPGAGNERLNPWDPGAEFNDQPDLSDFHDFLIDSDRAGGLSRSEEFALKALQGPLPVLLSELPGVYFDIHARGQEEKFRKNTYA